MGRTMKDKALSQSKTTLVVNADDFGICPFINQGIVAAHLKGIVTSTSLMAGGKAFEEAVRWCKRVPTLDMGVHLTLVAGKPILQQSSSLTGRDGNFLPGAHVFMARYLTGGIHLKDVENEWRAQIERILETGIPVTHLDSHQHIHVLPGLCKVVFKLSKVYDIPFVRFPFERLNPALIHYKGLFRFAEALALHLWGARFRRLAQRFFSRPPLKFLGFFDGGQLDIPRLLQILNNFKPGRYELMCHPGFATPSPEIKSWGYHHEEELRALTSSAIRQRIEALHIELSGFKEL